MKRLWAAGVIAIVLAALCWYGSWKTHSVWETMVSSVSEMENQAKKGNRKAALALSESLCAEWEFHYGAMSTYVPHDRLDELAQTLSLLPALLSHGADDQFGAECSRVRSQLEQLRIAELPTLSNIL